MANGSMISKATAMDLVSRFKANPSKATASVVGMRYDFDMIDELKGFGGEGVTITSVRIHIGMNEDFSLCTILVACDAEGNNYYGTLDQCLDQGEICPPNCGNNPL